MRANLVWELSFFLTSKTNAMKKCSFQSYPIKWLRLGMGKSKKKKNNDGMIPVL